MSIKELEFSLMLCKLNPTKQWKTYSDDGEHWNLGADGIRGMFLFNKTKEELINFVNNYE